MAKGDSMSTPNKGAFGMGAAPPGGGSSTPANQSSMGGAPSQYGGGGSFTPPQRPAPAPSPMSPLPAPKQFDYKGPVWSENTGGMGTSDQTGVLKPPNQQGNTDWTKLLLQLGLNPGGGSNINDPKPPPDMMRQWNQDNAPGTPNWQRLMGQGQTLPNGQQAPLNRGFGMGRMGMGQGDRSNLSPYANRGSMNGGNPFGNMGGGFGRPPIQNGRPVMGGGGTFIPPSMLPSQGNWGGNTGISGGIPNRGFAPSGGGNLPSGLGSQNPNQQGTDQWYQWENQNTFNPGPGRVGIPYSYYKGPSGQWGLAQ